MGRDVSRACTGSIAGMHYEVTRTHERGRRLGETEQLERAQGILTIEPYPSKHKGAVPRLAATLWGAPVAQRSPRDAAP